ncbi:aerial mycelium formation protein [Haloechinothrix sp. LS1_15]|uniref:RsiG family protein n=1 Tax=Haloechinothrix sp. LS1_15 TaxID=2652248 RepID=UPI00294724C2|nr:aerial mycelium formation protein [Haloechinothrix sp. LS1_15]MDV6012456.1 aerial mycelium formation protein [Haloechinothrix sp. LS1_15]
MIEVRPGGRRRIDRVLGEEYLRDLEKLPLGTLRERRDEASQEETDLSFLRRMLHARIDIVRAEQERRSSGGQASVVDQLAAILAKNAVHTPARPGRHQPFEPTRTGERRRQVEALIADAGLSDVEALSDEELTESLRAYTDEERSVSERRQQVQAVVDALNAEITARYAAGTASVDELLATERGEPG